MHFIIIFTLVHCTQEVGGMHSSQQQTAFYHIIRAHTQQAHFVILISVSTLLLRTHPHTLFIPSQ